MVWDVYIRTFFLSKLQRIQLSFQFSTNFTLLLLLFYKIYQRINIYTFKIMLKDVMILEFVLRGTKPKRR